MKKIISLLLLIGSFTHNTLPEQKDLTLTDYVKYTLIGTSKCIRPVIPIVLAHAAFKEEDPVKKRFFTFLGTTFSLTLLGCYLFERDLTKRNTRLFRDCEQLIVATQQVTTRIEALKSQQQRLKDSVYRSLTHSATSATKLPDDFKPEEQCVVCHDSTQELRAADKKILQMACCSKKICASDYAHLLKSQLAPESKFNLSCATCRQFPIARPYTYNQSTQTSQQHTRTQSY